MRLLCGMFSLILSLDLCVVHTGYQVGTVSEMDYIIHSTQGVPKLHQVGTVSEMDYIIHSTQGVPKLH